MNSLQYLSHINFIENTLKQPIINRGILQVGINLNDYLSFEKANEYASNYATKFIRKISTDSARQEKSSKDAVLGKLVEEVIVYLLTAYFKDNKLNYLVTCNKSHNKMISEIIESLCLIRKNTGHIKKFDSDIVIVNPSQYYKTRKAYILSAKGTTRERIGQFLSHLFLMDQDVLNVKYGKDRYTVIFTMKNINIKYGFVTFDWAQNRDFDKFTKNMKKRETVKSTEVQLILDDVKLGGGLFVINNHEHLDGIGNFAELVGSICGFLR